MLSAIYSNPTTVFFGRDSEKLLGPELARRGGKVLLVCGQGSIKQNGIYDRVTASLTMAGVEWQTLPGVTPNPRAAMAHAGIKLARAEGLSWVLGIGGGSVIDTAKAIAVGTPADCDVLDFFRAQRQPECALGIATVLTLPGSGSESSPAAVITDTATRRKLSFSHPLLFPTLSVLNPEFTCSLPWSATAAGIADAISHLLERYFSPTPNVRCTDRLGEALLLALLDTTRLLRDAQQDYELRSEIMWACKLAHDDTSGFGRKQDWASHKIAHEIGARYDTVHGPTVAIVFLGWMRIAGARAPEKFQQLANRVFGGNAVTDVIAGLTGFLRDTGLPTSLRAAGVPDRAEFPDIARACVQGMQSGTIGNFTRLAPEDIEQLLNYVFEDEGG